MPLAIPTLRPTLTNCVVLLDIDGTLLTGPSSGLSPGVAAMETAARHITGRAGLHQQVEFAGRTDRQIARDLLLAGGLANPSRDDTSRLLALYIEDLETRLAASSCRPLGDVRGSVHAMQIAGCTVGFGTGNLLRGARAKLASAGILTIFDSLVGGFGDDADERDELLRIGAQRCDPTGEKSVVVVGDTPYDVQAASAIHALCIGVTTGPYDEQSLRQSGAADVVHQLDASLVDRIESLLRSR